MKGSSRLSVSEDVVYIVPVAHFPLLSVIYDPNTYSTIQSRHDMSEEANSSPEVSSGEASLPSWADDASDDFAFDDEEKSKAPPCESEAATDDATTQNLTEEERAKLETLKALKAEMFEQSVKRKAAAGLDKDLNDEELLILKRVKTEEEEENQRKEKQEELEKQMDDTERYLIQAAINESLLKAPSVEQTETYGRPNWMSIRNMNVPTNLITEYEDDEAKAHEGGLAAEFGAQKDKLLESLGQEGYDGYTLASNLSKKGSLLTKARTFDDLMKTNASIHDQRQYISEARGMLGNNKVIIDDILPPSQEDIATYGQPTWVSSQGLKIKFLQKYDDYEHAERGGELQAWLDDHTGVMETLAGSYTDAKDILLASKLKSRHSILSRFKTYADVTDEISKRSFIQSSKALHEGGVVIVDDLEKPARTSAQVPDWWIRELESM